MPPNESQEPIPEKKEFLLKDLGETKLNIEEKNAEKYQVRVDLGQRRTCHKCRDWCSWRRCGVISGVFFILVGLVLLGGYLRYASKLTGTASSENSQLWAELLGGTSELEEGHRISGRYELVSYEKSHDAYLAAMGTPSFVINNIIKYMKEAIYVKAPMDLEEGTWKWDVVTDLSTKNETFKSGVDFLSTWGTRKKGILQKSCVIKTNNGTSYPDLICNETEPERGWHILKTYKFRSVGMIEEIGFENTKTGDKVDTKRYFEKKNKDDSGESEKADPNDPFSSGSSDFGDDDDDDEWGEMAWDRKK